MPRHRHEWHPLYRKPREDSEPKIAYCGDTLGDYLVCPKCSRVARSFQDSEEIKILPPRQAAAHRDRATRWNAEMPETIH